MSFEEVIEHTSNNALSLIEGLTPEKLNSALTAAQKKYGNPITRALLGKRIPSAKTIEEGPKLSLVKILLGEGSANSKGLKYLLLKELGFLPGAADNLPEGELQSLFRFILGELLSADVIRAYSEEQFKGQPDAFNEFWDTLEQFWAVAADARVPFNLSFEAMDELFQQFQNYGALYNGRPFIMAKNKPTKQWSIRTFFLSAQSLKSRDITALDLSLNDLFSLNESQLQAFGVALKNSKIITLDLSGSGNVLSDLDEFQWETVGAALKGSGVTTLGLSLNGLFSLNESQWQAFGAALKDSGVTGLKLSGNNLNELSEFPWQRFGESLKGSRVIALDLSDKRLFKLSKTQWQLFCTALKNESVHLTVSPSYSPTLNRP